MCFHPVFYRVFRSFIVIRFFKDDVCFEALISRGHVAAATFSSPGPDNDRWIAFPELKQLKFSFAISIAFIASFLFRFQLKTLGWIFVPFRMSSIIISSSSFLRIIHLFRYVFLLLAATCPLMDALICPYPPPAKTQIVSLSIKSF